MRLRTPCAFLLCALLGWVPLSAVGEEPDEEPKSYEFLKRQADLLFSYNKFDEAADSLVQACATEEGSVSRECHSRLANAAEKAGRVGLAIHAWELASVLGEEAQRESRAELERLYGAYGRLLLFPPDGRALPTRPLTLAHTGFLIDPRQKQTLAALVERTARKGLDEATIWLPFGTYELGTHTFEITAGEAFALVLDPTDVPHQTQALRGEASGFVPLGGPRELTIGVHVGLVGAPGDGVAVSPLLLGGKLTFGGHVGAVRVEARARVAGVRAQSPAGTERAEQAGVEAILGVDFGLDVRLSGSAWLTPHLTLLGGALGPVGTSCVGVQSATGHRWQGDCDLPSAGGGGAIGLDLLLLPSGDPRRVGVRIGLGFEALGGGVLPPAGAGLAGLGVSLESATPRQFVRLGGGLDVGVALRF